MGRGQVGGPEDVGGPEGGAHDGLPAEALGEALRSLDTAVDEVQGCASWALPDSGVRQALITVTALAARLESVRLRLVGELDRRPTAVPGARPTQVAATFLVHALNTAPAQAHRDAAAARTLDPDAGTLPRLGAALAAGGIHREHVDVAVRALTRIPTALLTRTDASGRSGAARIDAFLTEHSSALPPTATARLARHLLATLDPDATDRYDPRAYQRRSLTCAVDSTGMLVGSFQLDPAAGATVRAALDRYAAPHPAQPAESDTGTLIPDGRSRAQRYADALHAICATALRHRGAPPAPPPATLLVLTTADQLQAVAGAAPADPTDPAAAHGTCASPASGLAESLHTGPLNRSTLARLSCDATLHRVLLAPSGAVLDLGRSVRTVTAAQKRALAARDRGCSIPGCTAPPTSCDAHHVHPWQTGGVTDLDNLALLCSHHHSAVHARIWTVQMHHGLPWATPPAWIDPQRRPLRNTVHRAAHDAADLGAQLRLDDHPPPDEGWPGSGTG